MLLVALKPSLFACVVLIRTVAVVDRSYKGREPRLQWSWAWVGPGLPRLLSKGVTAYTLNGFAVLFLAVNGITGGHFYIQYSYE